MREHQGGLSRQKTGPEPGRFGPALKHWRRQRRLSQFDLGAVANVSARHLAFLETGRSRPSRAMVLMLADALDMPRSARNELLDAAGFAPAYRARALNELEMQPVRDAIDWTLDRHAPYPAFALDRHWVLVAANIPAERLLDGVGLSMGASLLDAMLTDGPLRATIINWPLAARYVAARLRTESAHLGGDPKLDAAATKLMVGLKQTQHDDMCPLPPFFATELRLGDAELSFFSTIAQFGTAEDVAIADLRIELMFPANDATRNFCTILCA